MYKLRKQLSLVLLSCVTIIFSNTARADFVNPFIPIYVKGDDTSLANPKPTIIYEEVPKSLIFIDDMPAYKTQDQMGDCAAFSLATIIQKYICDKWKNDPSLKQDLSTCAKVTGRAAISYFGMLIHTGQSSKEGDGSIELEADKRKKLYEVIDDIGSHGNMQILDSCKPFDGLVNSFSSNDVAALEKKNEFILYLKKMYSAKKIATEASILDCPECLKYIKQKSGLDVNIEKLKKALSQDTYDKFLYSLMFDGCELNEFPSGFSARSFPDDELSVDAKDVKSHIIKGLKLGKPVMYPSVCFSHFSDGTCQMPHSVVISGYKKVCEKDNSKNCKELLKVQNSWGKEWQDKNNDGWVDADILTSNTAKVIKDGKLRISSGSVIWLAP